MVEVSSQKGSPQRIIAHMNKDHKHSLEDYLYVYGNIPVTEKISNVRMKTFDLDHMTLVFQHEDIDFEVEKMIVFDPPLEGFHMAREKLVHMAKEAAKTRNYSHVVINDISYPASVLDYSIICLVLIPFVAYWKREVLWYLPLPAGAVQFLSRDIILLSVMVASVIIHAAECFFVLKPKLEFYRVPTDFLVEWYFFGMLEGYGAIKRFNSLAREKNH